MADQRQMAERFEALHRPGEPLLMANAWDLGSARLLSSLGFRALATTSSGYAASLGRLDYGVTREEAIEHGAMLAAAVELPVSADLEDCFPGAPGGVAETVRMAREAGLAGCSIEDWSAADGGGLLSSGLAAERVAEAAQAAAADGGKLVLTARAENHLRGSPDLDDTIARLLAYQEAGADVLYAPGLAGVEEITELLAAVERPVNVLVWPSLPPAPELAALGVARISVGGAFAFAAYGAAVRAARELQAGGLGFLERSREGARLSREAFVQS
jgi:2-methylisocitrate lyase-like PEP mutase family enzyme